MKQFAVFLGLLSGALPVHAVPALVPALRLQELHQRIFEAEQKLSVSVREKKAAREQMARLTQLLALQKQERELGKLRMTELERTVHELELRKQDLTLRLEKSRGKVQRYLKAMDRIPVAQTQGVGTPGGSEDTTRFFVPEQERIEAPKRRTLAAWAARGLREMEELKVDLQDNSQLESRIAEEKQTLTALIQDLEEQAGLLRVSRDLQARLARASQKEREERVQQIENYRRLKQAQTSVDQLVQDFHARAELQKGLEEQHKQARLFREMQNSEFAALRGKLSLPIEGARLVSGFGKIWDTESGLHVFKKGIELGVNQANTPVKTVYEGKIAYAGELPSYGKVAIVDHGGQFYTLVAHLGQLSKKAGDPVGKNDLLGVSDESGNPVYFEIRAKNVPVNPLQWLAPSINLK